jgi:hypothetical protein
LFSLVHVRNLSLKGKELDQSRTLNAHSLKPRLFSRSLNSPLIWKIFLSSSSWLGKSSNNWSNSFRLNNLLFFSFLVQVTSFLLLLFFFHLTTGFTHAGTPAWSPSEWILVNSFSQWSGPKNDYQSFELV